MEQNFAIIENETVTNIIVINKDDTSTIEAFNAVAIPNNLYVKIGFVYKNNIFIDPDPVITSNTFEEPDLTYSEIEAILAELSNAK